MPFLLDTCDKEQDRAGILGNGFLRIASYSLYSCVFGWFSCDCESRANKTWWFESGELLGVKDTTFLFINLSNVDSRYILQFSLVNESIEFCADGKTEGASDIKVFLASCVEISGFFGGVIELWVSVLIDTASLAAISMFVTALFWLASSLTSFCVDDETLSLLDAKEGFFLIDFL